MSRTGGSITAGCAAVVLAVFVVSGCDSSEGQVSAEGNICGDSEDVRWCYSTRAGEGAYSVSHGALLCEVRQARRLIEEGRVDHQALMDELPGWADGGFRRGQPTIVRISEVPAADVLDYQEELRVAVEDLGASFDWREVTECGGEMSQEVIEGAEGRPLQVDE